MLPSHQTRFSVCIETALCLVITVHVLNPVRRHSLRHCRGIRHSLRCWHSCCTVDGRRDPSPSAHASKALRVYIHIRCGHEGVTVAWIFKCVLVCLRVGVIALMPSTKYFGLIKKKRLNAAKKGNADRKSTGMNWCSQDSDTYRNPPAWLYAFRNHTAGI